MMDVRLGSQGIRELREKLTAMSSGMKSVTKETENKLGQIGVDELQSRLDFDVADGNKVGDVSLGRDSEGVQVAHTGDQVVYLEFGTGHVAKTGKEYPDKEAMTRAGYKQDGKGHGEKGWVYWNKHKTGKSRTTKLGISVTDQFSFTKGMVGIAPVYHAFKATEAKVNEVLKEVFDGKFDK